MGVVGGDAVTRSGLTRFPVWSSFALVPVVVVLAASGSWLAVFYAASLAVTLAYHLSRERRWRRLDHALAWSVIASNTWLALHTRSIGWTALGLLLVVVALWFYRRARRGRYDLRHGLWHLASGAACLAFALGAR